MLNNFNNKILIIAGEVSGEMHGAALVDSLKSTNSNLKFYGIGGDKMISAGVETLYHIKIWRFLDLLKWLSIYPLFLKLKKGLLSL